MTGLHLRRDWNVSAILLAAVAFLTGLGSFVASEMHRTLCQDDETILLFPGFTADDMIKPGRGLVVTSLQSGSEAQRDGIAVGDKLLAIDNHPIGSLDEARQFLGRNPGDMLALRLMHNSRSRELVLHANRVRQHEPKATTG